MRSPSATALADGGADVDAGDGAQRASALALGLPGHDAGRTTEPFHEATGDEADHALMPTLRRDHQHGEVGILIDQPIGLGNGLLEHLSFDGLPLAVQLVEQRRDLGRLDLVIRRQQARAERGVADATARIDARAQDEAQVIRSRRLVQAGRVDQRAQPRVLALTHDDEPARHERPVQRLQRHHVSNRGQRHEIEHGQEVRRRRVGRVVAALTKLARRRDEGHERDAGGAEVAQAREIILAVGVHNGRNVGKAHIGLMMVEDHDIGAERLRHGKGIEAGHAAVDGDDQAGAILNEPLDGRRVRAVALEDAVGDVDAGVTAVGRQKAPHQGGRAGAVDVIVAENGNGLALHYGVGDASGCLVHVDECRGVGHQRLNGRLQRDRHLVRRYSTGGQDAAQKLRQSMPLADRRRLIGRRRVQTLAPDETASRSRDAE